MNRLKKWSKVFYLSLGMLGFCVSVRASDTDTRIETAFNASPILKDQLKDDHVYVSSKDGVVTLTGEVYKENHKAIAENIVGGIPGVKRLDDQLKIEHP
jgi:osmotically-inducible protein OsmY